MERFKQTLRQIKIEEYVSIFTSIIFLIVILGRFYNYFDWKTATRDILYYILLGGPFFAAFFVFIYGYFYFKAYLFLGNLATAFFIKKRKIKIDFFQIVSSALKAFFSLFRDLFFIFFPLGLSVSLLRVGVIYLKPYLVDDFLMEVDKIITGAYPFIWLQNEIPDSIKFFLTPINIFSFYFLSILIGLVALVLYISKRRELFSAFLICLFVSLLVAMPLWFKFPALSPNNMYLNNVYERSIPLEIQRGISSYAPDEMTANFLSNIHESQKNSPPISTMPSMHVTWAIFLVYFAWKLKRWTLAFLFPWFIFNFMSTVYLAQHYFIDIVIALPIAVISIISAEKLASLRRFCYKENETEADFRKIVRKDLLQTLAFLKKKIKICL